MKVFYLYKIVNAVNDKVYIGMTSRPKEREREHFRTNSKCSKLLHAMNKHGRENFFMEILCIGSEDYILDLEFKAMESYDSLKNGYNIIQGHPNQLGVSLPKETVEKMSNSLKEFYRNNPGYLKDRPRKVVSASPYYISGFWFPSSQIGMSALGMNEKTFYRRRKNGTLGDCCHPVSNSIRHKPVYILGFWFDTLITAAARLNKDMNFLQLLIRKKDVEEALLRINSKSKRKKDGDPIGVTPREYGGTYRAVMVYKGETVLKKSFKTELEAATAYDDCYEGIHGIRPNNTKGVSPKEEET